MPGEPGPHVSRESGLDRGGFDIFGYVGLPWVRRMDGQPSGGFKIRRPERGAFGRGDPGTGKPSGGTVRSVKVAFEFILRDIFRRHIRADRLVEA
ncbi:MAG: hypothetical protein CMM23_02835 [Rhodospirillaceae bacterium]|jgi:hypothetical protein|nr:hypothetical protein [Rhodospirillaceae bacterium]